MNIAVTFKGQYPERDKKSKQNQKIKNPKIQERSGDRMNFNLN